MISVIIVTYNRAQLLEKCLQSIFNQNYDDPCEIILVDNGSTDGTSDLIEKKFQNQIHYLRFSQRRSIALCKKDALKIVQGEYVAFLDDDCTADPQWLRELEKSLAHHDLVGGPVLPYPPVCFPWWWRSSLDWIIGINRNPSKIFLPLGSNCAFKINVLLTLDAAFQKYAERVSHCSPYREDYYRLRFAASQNIHLCIHKDMIVYHEIPPERFRMRYLVWRSFMEGKMWVAWEPQWILFFSSVCALLINPVRFLFTGNCNHLLRWVVRLSYIYHFACRISRDDLLQAT